MKERTLAKRDTALLSPRAQIGTEIALRETGDEEFRFQLRKLGNIHLGVRYQGTYKSGSKAGQTYDSFKPTDFFVLPDELRDDPGFRAKLENIGQNPDQPNKLPIMLMSNDLKSCMVTSQDIYVAGGKLMFRHSVEPVYDSRGAMVGQRHEYMRLNPVTLDYETDCEPTDRELSEAVWYHRFRFILPDAAGIGYWQIVTKSDNNHGALLSEIGRTRGLRGGRIAGIDLVLTLTNGREFHPKVIDKSGKVSRLATNPFLMHIEGGTTFRAVLDAQQIGEVYDAEIIEVDTEDDAVPTVEAEEEFFAGEPEPVEVNEETGEIIGPVEATVEPLIPPATEDQIDELKALCVAHTLEKVPLAVLVIEATGIVKDGGKALNMRELNILQASKIIDRINELDPPEPPADGDPF